MNTRAVPQGVYFTPTSDEYHEKARVAADDDVPESKVFDKAEEAENKEKLRANYDSTGKELETLKKKLDEAATPDERDRIQTQVDNLQAQRDMLEELLKREEDEKE